MLRPPNPSEPQDPPAVVQQSPPHLDAAVTCLWVLTPLLATVSLVILCVAMTTNQWLHTEEKMTNPDYNGTGDKEYLSKVTVSGLWTMCYSNPGELHVHCFNIDYMPKEEYSPDPNDSTMAIPYAVTNSAGFFIAATFLLFIGEFCCLYGHFARHRRVCTFISGVACIISGLLMLIGLVMYISIFKAEVGNKLRPRSQLQPPLFSYRYGFSFILIVTGFMASEIAGTCAIFLYIYWHQKEWGRKNHELYLHRRKLSSSSSLLLDHHVDHNNPVLFPCRRHPQLYNQYRRSGYISPNVQQRRFYLDSAVDPDSMEASPCPHRHPNTISNSKYDFYPNTSSYQQHYFHHGDQDCEATPMDVHGRLPVRSMPRDATTNTVSTTADINSCEDDDYSPSLQHEHEFVTFDLDENPPRIEERRKEFGMDTLRRTTPV